MRALITQKPALLLPLPFPALPFWDGLTRIARAQTANHLLSSMTMFSISFSPPLKQFQNIPLRLQRGVEVVLKETIAQTPTALP